MDRTKLMIIATMQEILTQHPDMTVSTLLYQGVFCHAHNMNPSHMLDEQILEGIEKFRVLIQKPTEPGTSE